MVLTETLKIGSLVLRQPYHDLIPSLSEQEYAALRADISAAGRIEQPIVIDQTGAIIDGHHRARIAADLGLSPKNIPTLMLPGLSEEEGVGRAISLNVKRRHLSDQQRADVARNLRARQWSYPRIGAVMGVDDYTVARWLTSSSSACSGSAIAEPERAIAQGQDGKPYPATHASDDELAERRRKVKEGKAEGKSTRQIAAELRVSIGTVTADAQAGRAILALTANQAAAVLDALPNVDTIPETTADPKMVFRQERHDNLARAGEEILAARAEQPTDDEIDQRIRQGDFRSCLAGLADESVELILTDPPYDRESLPLYTALAEHAARLLAPGGSIIAYAGNYALPELFDAFRAAGLRYWWTLGIRHASNYRTLPGKFVSIGWKPLLWFVKEGRATSEIVVDLLDSPKPAKVQHQWEQGEAEAAYLIEKLTGVGQTVLDPMCGSGTTLAAAHLLAREYLGFDVDAVAVGTARGRLRLCQS